MENRQQTPKGDNKENIFATIGENIKSMDSRTAPWMFLGFCLPVAGLVLYLAWKDTREADAKAAGTGAALSIGITVALYGMMMAVTMLRIFF